MGLEIRAFTRGMGKSVGVFVDKSKNKEKKVGPVIELVFCLEHIRIGYSKC